MDRVDYQPILIQDILNYQKSDELDIAPWYQRRSVWSSSQKAYLINTLLVRMPIPSIYMRYTVDLERERVIKEIVDGQQRLRAVIEFTNDGFAVRHPEHKARVKYSSLKDSQKRDFLVTNLSVGVLVNATMPDVIEMFGRLNSVSKQLNDQEKRNANFSGEYKQFCLDEAAKRIEFWRQNGVFTANDIARMQEVQYISDIVRNILDGLSDFSQSALSEIYKRFEDEFPEQESTKKRLDRIFDLLLSVRANTIKDTIFSRSPVLFSLMLAINDRPSLTSRKLEQAMQEVDAKFNSVESENFPAQVDVKFREAIVQTSQRIASRRVRADYLSQYL